MNYRVVFALVLALTLSASAQTNQKIAAETKVTAAPRVEVVKPLPTPAEPVKSSRKLLTKMDRLPLENLELKKQLMIRDAMEPIRRSLEELNRQASEHLASLCKAVQLADADGKALPNCRLDPVDPKGARNDWSQDWTIGKPEENAPTAAPAGQPQQTATVK